MQPAHAGSAPSRLHPATDVSAGRYLVIGSFTAREKAEAWAARHRTFSPTVLSSGEGGHGSHRVVIGPLDDRAAETLPAAVRAAGIGGAWFMQYCGNAHDGHACRVPGTRAAARRHTAGKA